MEAELGIDIETVRSIAGLSGLEFSEEEIRVLSRQLQEILAYVEKLNELDLRSVEPTSHAALAGGAFREDRVVPSVPVSEALAGAPESRSGHFAVPKVIG